MQFSLSHDQRSPLRDFTWQFNTATQSKGIKWDRGEQKQLFPNFQSQYLGNIERCGLGNGMGSHIEPISMTVKDHKQLC